MKKLSKTLLSVSLVSLSLAGCGAAENASEKTSSTKSTNIPGYVTVYTGYGFSGASQHFPVGRYYADRGELGYVGNDSISSLYVPARMRVKACEHEGFFGGGAGYCHVFGPGTYSYLGRLTRTISYLEVSWY